MSDPRIGAALQRFVLECEASGHELCDKTMLCEDGWKAHRGEDVASELEFDAGRSLMAVVGKMPGHHWSTTTLVAFVRHHLMAQPNVRGLWRGTAITTALARLAERGIPADCIVRTCVGPALTRRIIFTATSMLSATRRGKCDRLQVPELEPWFRLLESDPELADPTVTDPDLLASTAIRGAVRDEVENWLATVSITHILGWRIENPMVVHPDESALALPGGIGASRWFYERSILTYPAEWCAESRRWESAYLADPEAVARRAGLPLEILAERQVGRHALDRAHLELILGRAVPVEVDGLSGPEVVEMILSLLSSGALRPARDTARRASERYPEDDSLRLAYAFCTIPFDPAKATEILDGLSDFTAASAAAQVDRATISLLVQPSSDLSALVTCSEDELDSKCWLWDPLSFASEPRTLYASPREWLAMLRTRPVDGQPSSAR